MLPSLQIKIWKEKSLDDLAKEICAQSPKPLVLIDGKAGSGKTSFAKKLADILNADVVSTDDVCWCASPVDWDGEMLDGVLRPWLDGKDVSYAPSGWIKEKRQGCVTADASRPLVVEGSLSCRKSLRAVASYSIWVDTEPDTARSRVIARDMESGENGGTLTSVTEFTDWWDSLVDPFLLEEAAWRYVNTIVSGTLSQLSSDKILCAAFQRGEDFGEL